MFFVVLSASHTQGTFYCLYQQGRSQGLEMNDVQNVLFSPFPFINLLQYLLKPDSVVLYFSEKKSTIGILLISVFHVVSSAQLAVLLRTVSLICRDSGGRGGLSSQKNCGYSYKYCYCAKTSRPQVEVKAKIKYLLEAEYKSIKKEGKTPAHYCLLFDVDLTDLVISSTDGLLQVNQTI